MNSSWQLKKFGECAELIRDTCRPDEIEGAPYIGLEHIEVGTLRLLEIGNSNDVTSIKSQFEPGDILFGKLRPYFRKVVRPSLSGVCSTDIWVVRAKNSTDQGYLFYWMASHEFVDSATQASEGTKMPRAKWDFLERIEKPVPPLPEQRAIAAILGALDDKIELNRRMNQTLEAIAQALFKSWFVDFEPFRDQGMQDSPLGEIPVGWGVSTIGSEVSVVGGSTPSTKETRYWDGGKYHWATPKDLSALESIILLDTERKITEDGLATISSRLLPPGVVLLSSRAPIGYLAISVVPVAVNQGFIAMICNRLFANHYVLLWAKHNLDNIKARANGTTFLEVSKSNFRPIPVIVPPEEVMLRFDTLVAPLFSKVTNNLRESFALSTIRDALLPKLLSGEMRVKDAEKFVEKAL